MLSFRTRIRRLRVPAPPYALLRRVRLNERGGYISQGTCAAAESGGLISSKNVKRLRFFSEKTSCYPDIVQMFARGDEGCRMTAL
jgi:hypothetical protein